MNKALFSSERMDWETPQDFFDELDKKYHFTLDPCASKYNHKCNKYYTKEDDGLLKSWKNEIVFCNPPYGRSIYNWVKKCSEESKHSTIVLLIPSRTDTKYFHEFLYKKENVELIFIKGRLKFGDGKNSAPFPSMLAIFRGDSNE